MKFHDSSFNGLKVTVGTKKCDARTLQKQYAPSTFLKLGHNNPFVPRFAT